MNDQQRIKRLERAERFILFRTPFFISGVVRLPVEFDDTVVSNGHPTACTDGKRIRWHRAHFDSLPDEIIPTVLVHEVWHCMAGHLWRMPKGADCSTWNEACDHAVNTALEEFSALVKAQGMGEPFPLPKGCLHDAQYKGMAEEAIFARLSHRPPPGGSGGGNKPKPGAAGAPSGASGQPKAGAGGKKGGSKGQTPAAGQPESGAGHSGGSGPERVPFAEFAPQNEDAPEAKQEKSEWEGVLIQSVEAMKGRGKLPGSLERYVKELISPKVPWQELLRNFLREQAQDDWDWMQPNRYYETDFILPSLHSERIGAVVFGTDWSGSTQAELVDKFHAEKVECFDTLRPQKLVDIGFDTRVVWQREYRQGEELEKVVRGGGGTSFVDLFKVCAEMNPLPKCVVVLTDLDGTMPKEEPPFPVLWVVYGGGNKAPFGEVIQVD